MKIFFVLSFCLIAAALSAQKTDVVVDSLLRELPKAADDTVRSRIYIRLHDKLHQSDPEKALFYARKGLKIVTKMNWHKGLSAFYNDMGNNFLDQGKHKEALEHFLQSLNYSSEIPNIRAMTLQNTSIVYFKEENIPLAIKYNNEAFQLAKKENFTQTLAECYCNYGLIYNYLKDNSKAKTYFEKSLSLWKKEGAIQKQAIVLSHLGDVSKDLKVKMNFYLQSKAIWDKENPTYLLAVSNVLGLVETNITLAKNEALRQKYGITKSKNELLTVSENYLKEAIAYSKQANVQQNLMYSYGKMSEVKELQGDFKAGLDYINLNYEIYISIFSQENKNKIASLESQQKLMAKDKEIAIKKLTIQQNEKQKWYYISSILLLATIGTLLFYQNKNRRKTNQKLQLLNSELDQANQTKTRFFSILNHDLRSPVSNLIDFLHLQEDSPDLLDEETKKRIEKSTLLSAENLLISMEDILQWSKSQMKNFKPQPKTIAISTLFEDVQNHFLSEEKVTLHFENKENITLNTDENYLKTIIRNLTGNAIKALDSFVPQDESDNPTITWKAWNVDNQTFLSISDNGKGGTEEQFKALYDDTEVVGIKTGLGLHLIRDLAKAIDCTITVESKPNQGTTFTLGFSA